MAIIVHKQTEAIEANLASSILLAPIKFPTLVAAANPTDKDITKKKLAIFIAIACPATTSLPNGDIIKVLEISRIIDLYDFRFAEVTVQMIDYPKMKPFDTVLMLDTINLETPSLNYEKANHLYNEVMKDYVSEKVKYKRFLKVKNNKYFNALQVKFSYAVTCHKSQGGQWSSIFVEQPYLPNGIDKDFIRWLYTALTRAKEKLYLIGFKDEFFSN